MIRTTAFSFTTRHTNLPIHNRQNPFATSSPQCSPPYSSSALGNPPSSLNTSSLSLPNTPQHTHSPHPPLHTPSFYQPSLPPNPPPLNPPPPPLQTHHPHHHHHDHPSTAALPILQHTRRHARAVVQLRL